MYFVQIRPGGPEQTESPADLNNDLPQHRDVSQGQADGPISVSSHSPSRSIKGSVMAYFHQRRRKRRRIPKRIPNPIDTLYYAQLFPLVWRRRQRRRLFPMVTVPILGMDLHPRDRSPSLFHTFELGD